MIRVEEALPSPRGCRLQLWSSCWDCGSRHVAVPSRVQIATLTTSRLDWGRKSWRPLAGADCNEEDKVQVSTWIEVAVPSRMQIATSCLGCLCCCTTVAVPSRVQIATDVAKRS